MVAGNKGALSIKDKKDLEKAIDLFGKKQKRKGAVKSNFNDPFKVNYGVARNIRQPYRSINAQILRRVAEKAWLINTIIGHISDKIVPYLRPLSAKGIRGFAIELKDEDKKATKKTLARAKEIQEFFLNTGWKEDPTREDDLVQYSKKIIRDLLTLDQVSCEVQWKRSQEPYAFWAVDAATVYRCSDEGYEGNSRIKYVQMVHNMVTAHYTSREMIFQFNNPRTDVDVHGYGYSKVEQAIDLVTSMINTFAFNMGAFTEDKLPRGMLLLNGDAGFDDVDMIEDYLIDVMSSPSGARGKWTIPIIPSGGESGKKALEWVNLNQSNQDMQFAEWQDTLFMSIAALYGVDLESMGIKSHRGAKLMESGSAEGKKYSDDKGIGSALTFLQAHFQKILDWIDPEYRFVFHGFEQDDAKETRENRESRLKTFTSLNEERARDDLPPFDAEWANVPGLGSPQVLQAYQAEQNAGQEEDGGDPEMEGDSGEEEDFWGKSIKNEIIIEI